jgi:hypothetical protein
LKNIIPGPFTKIGGAILAGVVSTLTGSTLAFTSVLSFSSFGTGAGASNPANT